MSRNAQELQEIWDADWDSKLTMSCFQTSINNMLWTDSLVINEILEVNDLKVTDRLVVGNTGQANHSPKVEKTGKRRNTSL